jgi:CDP-diacylglycerol---serine O-phosphatidyltransferase
MRRRHAPDAGRSPRRRKWQELRQQPRRGIFLLPSLLTTGNLFCGFLALVLASQERYTDAAISIFVGMLMDMLDGKVARMTKTTSQFGVELDSLADVVSFGVAPAFVLYSMALAPLGRAAWLGAFLFVICGALRLARFNVMADDPNRPAWAGNFFTGVPAPAGALVVMLPIYVDLLGGPKANPTVTLLYTLAIAFLMVSRLPVFSGKRVGKRINPDLVLPGFVAVVLFFALLIAYPWWVLSIGTLVYLACLPLGWHTYREYARKDAEAAAAQAAVAGEASDALPAPKPDEHGDLPTRH